MSTQKSRIHGPRDGGPDEPVDVGPEPGAEEPKAGPPLDENAFMPQESGYEEIAGHQVRRLTHEELMARHFAETGGAPMWESFVPPNDPAVQAARRAREAGMLHEEVDAMMPEWMQARRQVAPPPRPPQVEAAPAQRDTTEYATPRLNVNNAQEAVDVLSNLNRRATQAQADGDLMGAKALRDAIQDVAGASNMVRRYEPQQEHPVMAKLRSSLGLKKIQPIKHEWAGFDWHCYPANVILDAWLLDNLWDDQRNFAMLKLATYCVGIDDTPLYDIFNIPLQHSYEVTVQDSKGNPIKQPLALKPYHRVCMTCGIELPLKIKIEDEDRYVMECFNCGAAADPFRMPMPLRLLCAEKLYAFLQEEFGPTERLNILVGQLRDKIPDRYVDMDELYPLAKLSEEAPTTDGSQSGEEVSPEQVSSPQTQEQ